MTDDLETGRPSKLPTQASQGSTAGIQSTAAGASIIQVETLGAKGIAILWWSSLLSALSVLGLVAMIFAFWITRVDMRVNEDETLRLRAAMIAAHIPIPDPEH